MLLTVSRLFLAVRSVNVLFISTRHSWILFVILINTAFIALFKPAFSHAFSSGSGGAVIWGDPQLTSTTAYNGAFIPVLKAASDGRLMIAYNQDTVSGELSVENPYFRESSDGGRTWSQPAAIRESGLNLSQVALDFDPQDRAHAVWRTDKELWHAREDQWPFAANPITSTAGLVRDPDFTIDLDGVIHVAWAQYDYRIYYARSEDDGNTWSAGTALSSSGNWPESPAIAVDDAGNVHVVWDERIYYDCIPLPCSKRYDVLYTTGVSESLGINWSGSPSVISSDVENAVQPDIVAQGDQIHVAFARRDGTEPDVDQYAYYTSHDTESGWSEPIDITHVPVTVHSNLPLYLDPVLVPCDDALYVYYHGAFSSAENETIMSTVNADGWDQSYSIDVGNARSIRPSAVCLGGKIHLVYEKVIWPNFDHQIYYLSGHRYATFAPIIRR